MVRPGFILTGESGHRYQIVGPLCAKAWDAGRGCMVDAPAMGGQGEVFIATDLSSDSRCVVKIFKPEFANAQTLQRVRFLKNSGLAARCSVICTPTDVIATGGLVGHISPLAQGMGLTDFIAQIDSGSFGLLDALQVLVALVHAIRIAHESGIAHGDLHPDNIRIHRLGKVIVVYVIDWDNYASPRVPAPPMAGRKDYMAAELLEALRQKRAAIPNIQTDLFSIGVLLHLLLLLRHPVAGHDSTEEEFRRAYCCGTWVQDPAGGTPHDESLGGYAVRVLSAELMHLFRCLFSLDPKARPPLAVVEDALLRALDSNHPCPACGYPCLIDISKTHCPNPHCRQPFPGHRLVVASTGRTIEIKDAATCIGRKELTSSPRVSARHAVFRRIGPEIWIEPRGQNGTYLLNGSGWERVEDRVLTLLEAGDRLRLGDVEVQLEAVAT